MELVSRFYADGWFRVPAILLVKTECKATGNLWTYSGLEAETGYELIVSSPYIECLPTRSREGSLVWTALSVPIRGYQLITTPTACSKMVRSPGRPEGNMGTTARPTAKPVNVKPVYVSCFLCVQQRQDHIFVAMRYKYCNVYY